MSYEMIEREIRALPEDCISEVGEFIMYLKLRMKFADFERQERLRRFDSVCEAAQKWAKDKGITEAELAQTIKEIRRKKRA